MSKKPGQENDASRSTVTRRTLLQSAAGVLTIGVGSANAQPDPDGVGDGYEVIHRDPVYIINEVDPEVHRVVKGCANVRLAPNFYENDWDVTWWGDLSVFDNSAEGNRLSSVGLTADEIAFLSGLTDLTSDTMYYIDLTEQSYTTEYRPDGCPTEPSEDPGFEEYTKTLDEHTDEIITYEPNPENPLEVVEVHEYNVYITRQRVEYQVIAQVSDLNEGLHEELQLKIDVKPGSDVNPINPRSKGVIPVAICGSEDFDVTTIDVSSIRFDATDTLGEGPDASPVHEGGHIKDVNGDCIDDLVVHFRTQETQINEDGEVTLVGQTNEGTPIRGTDEVTVVGRGKKGKGC